MKTLLWFSGLKISEKFSCGGNSVVECDLAKVDVEGSNPFRRSILLRYYA